MNVRTLPTVTETMSTVRIPKAPSIVFLATKDSEPIPVMTTAKVSRDVQKNPHIIM